MSCKNYYERYPCYQKGCYIIGPTGPTGPSGGVTGPTGATGPPPNLQIGTVITGAPGTQASVRIIPVEKANNE